MTDVLERGDAGGLIEEETHALLSSNEKQLVEEPTRRRTGVCSFRTASLLTSFVAGVACTLLTQYLCFNCIGFNTRSDISNPVIRLADPSAGATTHHKFPPASPTNAFPSLFPTDVGHAGPTTTGGEAGLVITAPIYPAQTNTPNLVKPASLPKSDDELDHEDRHKKFDLFRSFGNLSPWYSVPSKRFGLEHASAHAPEGCQITGLHLLHRHGARYPTNHSKFIESFFIATFIGAYTTSDSYGGPSLFASRIREANRRKSWTGSASLKFLNSW
jgi:hypothetical protein